MTFAIQARGTARIAARRLYQAALAAGWDLRQLDLADGYVRLHRLSDGAVLVARRVGDAGYWQANVEHVGEEWATIGRRGDTTVVRRPTTTATFWLYAEDGSRTFRGGAAMFRAIGAHITDNPGRCIEARQPGELETP